MKNSLLDMSGIANAQYISAVVDKEINMNTQEKSR